MYTLFIEVELSLYKSNIPTKFIIVDQISLFSRYLIGDKAKISDVVDSLLNGNVVIIDMADYKETMKAITTLNGIIINDIILELCKGILFYKIPLSGYSDIQNHR